MPGVCGGVIIFLYLVCFRTDSVNTNTNRKMPTSGVAEEAALLG